MANRIGLYRIKAIHFKMKDTKKKAAMKRAFQIGVFSTIFILLLSLVAFGAEEFKLNQYQQNWVHDYYHTILNTIWNKNLFKFAMISLGIIFLLAARPLSNGIPPEVPPKVEAKPEKKTFGTLTLSTSGQLGKSYPIGEKGLIVGRDPGQCDIVISDPNVSRVHAWMTVKKGEVVLIDRGSTNGTFVNNIKVENAKLKSGDVIQLGQKCMTKLIFEQ